MPYWARDLLDDPSRSPAGVYENVTGRMTHEIKEPIRSLGPQKKDYGWKIGFYSIQIQQDCSTEAPASFNYPEISSKHDIPANTKHLKALRRIRSSDPTMAPFLNKAARAKLGKDTINNLIPQILSSNTRAMKGVNSSELIHYDASLVPPKQSSTPTTTDSTSPPIPSPKIKVIKSDTFDAVQGILQSDLKPSKTRLAALNMCSVFRPGGGVLNGARAQEESLCTRSTLYPSLREENYRLPEDAAIYTPDVLVFRASDLSDLPKQDWFFVDVISCPALKGPDVVESDDGSKVYEEERSREVMTMKVRLILQVAAQKGVTHLVLGALGCGAYGNPPAEVARIFKRVICGDRRRAGVTGIEEIVFAIFDEGENLETFRSVFRDVVSGE
jgi:uncharacterized protein (TIGR02452 family)